LSLNVRHSERSSMMWASTTSPQLCAAAQRGGEEHEHINSCLSSETLFVFFYKQSTKCMPRTEQTMSPAERSSTNRLPPQSGQVWPFACCAMSLFVRNAAGFKLYFIYYTAKQVYFSLTYFEQTYFCRICRLPGPIPKL